MPLFHVLTGGKAYMSKTFDDQIGVALMVEVLRHFSQASHSNVLYGVATVMEEVGPPGGWPYPYAAGCSDDPQPAPAEPGD